MARPLLRRLFTPAAVLLAATSPPGSLAQAPPPAKPARNCDLKAPTDQTCAAPQAAAPPSTPSTPPPAAPSQFPYPGDAPPATSSPAQPSTPAANKFPYPGDAAPPPADSSSSSSSSDSGGLPDPADTSKSADQPADRPSGRRKLPKVQNLQSDDDREAEDVKVAHFYHDSGNLLAAYNRLHDATRLIGDDPDAWYLLGQVAEKLHKQDESLAAFRRFLRLEPDTHRAKELQKTQPDLKATR